MRADTIQSASLICDTPTVFRCYIRIACSLQTNCCRVHLEAAWGNRSHTQFDWHALTSPNEPKIIIKNASAWFSPSKQGWSESACCTLSSFFLLYLITILSFSPSLCPSACTSPSLPLSLSLCLSVFFSFLWISAHCATRKCTSRGCQLHHGAFYLECPEPSVYQWNQPGI